MLDKRMDRIAVIIGIIVIGGLLLAEGSVRLWSWANPYDPTVQRVDAYNWVNRRCSSAMLDRLWPLHYSVDKSEAEGDHRYLYLSGGGDNFSHSTYWVVEAAVAPRRNDEGSIEGDCRAERYVFDTRNESLDYFEELTGISMRRDRER